MHQTPELDSKSIAEENGLRYMYPEKLTITRVRAGQGFGYRDAENKKITDKTILERIKRIKIPPAYQDVHISPFANGHLQAIGKDERGRTQYLYHPNWRVVRDANKFEHMLAFGQALPAIRETVYKHLHQKEYPRQKLLAAIVAILDKTHIRIGNEEYAKTNKSYGLTTLHNRHAKVHGDTIQFSFRGKRGIQHTVEFHDKELAKIIHTSQELPGYELFEYRDHEGIIHRIESNDVNEYLKEICQNDFTAKDFRTWHATVSALKQLLIQSAVTTKTELKQNIAATIRQVASELGNTPAICKKSYIHPGILTAYLEHHLPDCAKRSKIKKFSNPHLKISERATLVFLAEYKK